MLIPIKEVEANKRGTVKGVVNFTEAMTKPKVGSPKPYLKLELEDSTERIYFFIWEADVLYNEIKTVIKPGSYIEADIEYVKTDAKGYKEYKIHSLKPCEKPGDNCLDIDGLKKELKKIMNSIDNKDIQKIVKTIFRREDVVNTFFLAPCTEKSGYAFKGGALAHTVRRCKLIDAILPVFKEWNYNTDNIVTQLNRDVLVAVGLLGDIGSCFFYDIGENSIKKSLDGELFEYSYLTMKIVMNEIEKSQLNENQKRLLEHALLSSRKYGSDTTPRTKDAVVFSAINKLDADVANFEHLQRNNLGSDFGKILEKVYCLLDF